MSMSWTAEQQQVIDLRNRNILVSAAAGSGKTAVLVERIITMITDEQKPIDIDRLLIVTFTNAAAAEMRERISAAVEKKLLENPEDAHLQRQSTLIHVAKITTIHSFCLHIIRSYSGQLEIDPSFRIGDEGELKLLKADVIDTLLNDYYEEGSEGFANFIESYALGKSDYGIPELILRLYEFSQSYPWPSKWLEQCRDTYGLTAMEEIQKTVWMQYLVRDVELQTQELLEQSDYGLSLCLEPDGPYMYEKMFLSDRAVLMLLKEAKDYESICQVLKYLSFDRMSSKKDTSVDPDKRAAAAAVRDKIKKTLQKMREFYYFEDTSTIPSDLAGSREAVSVLIQLVLDFTERFGNKKREKNILDFNDFEHLALKVLVTEQDGETIPTPAALELSRQFEEILIDEYQDSNLVQETLLTSISRERNDDPNVFMVGDVKQSIYRFRLARPELFMKKYDTYDTADSKYQKIELHKNFRSRALVLNSINFIFFQIMQRKMGNIQYTGDAALYPGVEFPLAEGKPAGTKTEVLLADLEEGIAEGRSRFAEDQIEYTQRELEAKLIAVRIRELTDPETGLCILDKETKAYRTAEYKDMVILLRSLSGWSDVFVNVLAAEGIPAFAQTQSGYFNAVEVKTVLCILKLIDNPMDDIPLAAVLKSPVGGLSSEEIAVIVAAYKSEAKKNSLRGLYAACASYMEKRGESEPLSVKLICFFGMLEEFRHLKTYLNIHDLLYRVLQDTGYYAYVSAMPMGEMRQANLDMLVAKAVAYEQTSYYGLFHFIRYIEKLQKYDTDYGEAALSGENDNTVRIMSIHKSKGLEFPIVFLAGLNKQFNRQDSYSKILLHPDMGIAAEYVNVEKRIKAPTLMKKVFRRRLELEDLGEELRVLYVAMTRAKEKLIMTGTGKKIGEKFDKFHAAVLPGQKMLPFTLLSSANSYLDWICMSLGRPEEFPEQEELFQIKIVALSELVEQEVIRQTEDEILRGTLEAMDLSKPFDETSCREIEERLTYVYPHIAASGMHTKMSVSELKQLGQMVDEDKSEIPFLKRLNGGIDEEEEREPVLPKFLMEDQPLKGAAKGSAYHRVLELMDFTKADTLAGIKKELKRLFDSNKISEQVYQAVYPPVLRKFFQSDIGRRMTLAQQKHQLQKEKQFVLGTTEPITNEMVLIQGIIDAFFPEEDGLVLVDYKTDRAIPGQEQELLERYQVQLEYYQKALEQITGEKVKEVTIYSLSLGKGITLNP